MSAEMEIVLQAVAFRRNETGAENHEEIRRWSGSLSRKKFFELRLFAIFNYKNSHCFFNTKIFNSCFLG